MLIDEVEVTLFGGKGGNGIVSFGKLAHSGPDGGNGGKGGDLYLVAESDLYLLNQFSSKNTISADPGDHGGRNKRSGKDGDDLEIKVPVGTAVVDKKTGYVYAEFVQVGQKELLCKGGKGGKGNFEFRSSTNTTPEYATEGKPGERIKVILNLKLIADYGLIGLPNAGKSSLLNELTRAKAKIDNYPFTTLSPNLGVYEKQIIADVPGLIEGASSGKGLGTNFLKHIDKVKKLLHCIAADSPDPAADYRIIRNELQQYNQSILAKDEIILITKRDLTDEKTIKSIVRKMKKFSPIVLPVSIYDFESLEKLKSYLK